MSTKIEYVHDTWNPITGCTRVSEGCENCYAQRMSKRLRGRFGYPRDDPWRVTFHEDRLDDFGPRQKPRRILVCSMGDLFHESVEFGWLRWIFGAMTDATQHTFLVLTKRPDRALAFDEQWEKEWLRHPYTPWFPHIWLGVSVENQELADERIPLLLQVPAAKHWVSYEPALGPVDLGMRIAAPPGANLPDTPWPTLDWIVAGGETGPGARPAHPDWFRAVRDQCQDAGVKFFFKQMWGKEPTPPDLMVREHPT